MAQPSGAPTSASAAWALCFSAACGLYGLAEVEEAAAELQTALEVIGRDVEVRPVFGGARRAEAEDIVGGADIELRAGKLASHAVTLITLRDRRRDRGQDR